MSASSIWQNRFNKEIEAKVRSLHEGLEEIDILKQAADTLRNFRNQLVAEKFD